MTTTPERTATLTSLVAAEIRALMGRQDVRQSELARRMGESDQWMSMRLKGRTPIDVNELQRIAVALGVRVHELLPPPDVAAKARISLTEQYLRGYEESMPSRPSRHARPRDNRPAGHPVTSGVRRSAELPRPPYGRAA